VTAAQVTRALGAVSSSALDLIRGVASMAVVVGHAISFFLPELKFFPPNGPYIQNIAVALFFIVSGYLIAHQIESYLHKRRSFGDFFLNRFARIYSGYVPALLFILAVDLSAKAWGLPYGHDGALTLKTFAGNLLMLQDWPVTFDLVSGVTSFGSGRPLWTLAIEWWIYLFVGWLVFRREALLAGRPGDWLLVLAFAIVPVFNLVNGRGNALFLYWLVGAAGYLFVSRLSRFQLAGPYLLGCLLVAAAAIYRLSLVGWEAYEAVFVILMALAFVLLMAGLRMLDGEGEEKRGTGFVHFFAGASFTLYMIHYSIQETLVRLGQAYGQPRYVMLALAIALPVLLALLIAPWTEMRYRSLAKRLESRSTRRKPV